MHHNHQIQGRALEQNSATPRLSTRALVLTAMFAAVTSVLAYVRIPLPFSPVPVTGQTFGVMLAGILLGARLGGMSLFVYMLMGAVGLPVFSGGTAGLGILLGPTGGYLWGSIAGAYVAGLIAGPSVRRGSTKTAAGGSGLSYVRALFAAVLGGIVAVYGIGVVQLAIVTGMAWRESLVVGVLPFLPGDLLKAAVAAAVAVRLAPMVGDANR